MADYLSRHKDPWAQSSISVLRAEGLWDWKKTMVVVLGAEIGLTTTVAGLLGSVVSESNIRRMIP